MVSRRDGVTEAKKVGLFFDFSRYVEYQFIFRDRVRALKAKYPNMIGVGGCHVRACRCAITTPGAIA